MYIYNNDFLQAYPIVFGTTHSIVSSLNMNNALFDYIIIDESSQVDILTGVLALSIAKNAVIVGDKKQLSCIIDANIIKK
ncbi:AAA domain-containing protein [Helicobacter trogontum]|uniref:AAA domain-containing protein n=1 Tax=Helicobacter trogontum TaxID=50960 RepID=UPI00311A1B27